MGAHTRMTFDRKSAASTALAFTVIGLMTLSYLAGTAQATAGPSESQAKLDQTHDLLTKGHAVLGSISSRPGYANIEAAKKQILAAQAEIQKAKAAIGG
jgi:hypothetical protein